MKKLTFLLGAFGLFIGQLTAQPFLVKDIKEGSVGSISFFDQDTKAIIAGIYYFTADEGINGKELWRSDATNEGTYLVKDINSGSTGADPSNFVVSNDILYFTANDGEHGEEVWRTDGTEEGTYMLKDIAMGSGSSISFSSSLIAVGDNIYFTADDNIHGQELWFSDGTEEGTVLLDLKTGSTGSNPKDLYDWNGTLYFVGEKTPDSAGSELYKTDGTLEGTTLLKDILEGFAGSIPQRLTGTDDLLFFLARDLENGRELWCTDGTTEGTHLVINLKEGSASPFESDDAFYPFGDLLLFTADTEENDGDLWMTDGTEEGTEVLYAFNDFFVSGIHPNEFFEFEGEVYFKGSDNQIGTGLWKTDGTTEGTIYLESLSGGVTSNQPFNIFSFAEKLYVIAARSAVGTELWQTNGEAGEATLVLDINPGSSGSVPFNFAMNEEVLFFIANNGVTGSELWAFIAQPEPLVVAVEEVMPVICNGDATAELLVTPSGGIAPYTYEWGIPGIEGNNPTGLSADIYALTVSDVAGNNFSVNIEINDPPVLGINGDSSSETEGQQDGSIAAFAFGGTSPHFYLWDTDPPFNGNLLFNLSAGVYTLTLTDGNGCIAIESFEVGFITSTINLDNESTLKIFPNPVQDQLNLQLTGIDHQIEQLQIRNAQGQLLWQGPFQHTINIGHLPTGSYWLEVMHKQGIRTIQILKQ